LYEITQECHCLYWVSKVERLSSTNEGGTRLMSVTIRHIVRGTEILPNH
jgi:hypothetical protein